MTDKNNETIFQHYLKLIKDTANEKLKLVLAANNIALEAKKFSDLQPVPVYEEGKENLLSLVQKRMPTTISFPVIGEFQYVPAYYKKYRNPEARGYKCEIVVSTDNYCYSRLYVTKELMHCCLDDDGIPKTDSFDLVNELIDELSINHVNSPQTVIDEVAWQGAINYLIPESWLPLLKKLHADYCEVNPGCDDEAYRYLANKIRVPENLFRIRLRSQK